MQDGEKIDIHTYIALVKSLYQNANVSVFTIKIDNICLIYRIISFTCLLEVFQNLVCKTFETLEQAYFNTALQY